MSSVITSGTDTKGVGIGIWGARGSGKTTYIAMLYHECLLSNDWAIEPLDRDSLKFVTTMHRNLRHKGVFPPRSDASLMSVYRFAISRKSQGFLRRKHNSRFILEFPDPAGEWYDNRDVAMSKYPTAANPIHYLVQCDALLFLIDPKPEFASLGDEDHAHLSYFELLMDVLFEIREKQRSSARTPRHLAVVFTKMDQPGRWQMRNQLERFAAQTLEPESLSAIHNTFPETAYRYFATSSIGIVEESGGVPVPNCVSDGSNDGETWRIREPGKLKPFGLMDPIDWLLKQLEG